MIRVLVATAILMSLLVLNFVDLNKRRISVSEFVFWQTISILLIGLFIFPAKSQEISEKLGFELLANFVFSTVIVVLLIIVRVQSRLIHQMKSQIQNIVEKIALDEN